MQNTILLDFDDVVNIFPGTGQKHVRRSGWRDSAWKKVQYGPYVVNYNEEMIDAINALQSREENYVLWLTSWLHDEDVVEPDCFYSHELKDHLWRNNQFFLGLGFENFMSVDAPGRFNPGHGNLASEWWKFKAIDYVLDNHYTDHVVVFDDALTNESGKKELKKRANLRGIQFDGVTVSTGLGLTKREFVEFTS